MKRSDGGQARLRRAPGLRVLLLVLGLAFAPPAAATSLPPSENPLPGSSFQGADGDQDDAAPLTDWQSLITAARVGHNPDPNAQDSAFAGGSKEGEPGNWDFTVVPGGVTPAKANIYDAWTGSEQGGASTFGYLAFKLFVRLGEFRRA